jgi:FtsP/CotA-like multicopper oxidase with cupredoxin domain
MSACSGFMPTRRALLAAGAASLLAPGAVTAQSARMLRAAPASVRLVPEPHPPTEVWAYDGTVPGPELRLRQGERLRVVVENALPQETTVHWHGIRLLNAMDGVPHLTQRPIPPGARFTYEFDLPDAGTFWYHPHHRSAEQVGRGLAGALIVEEREPIRVDRDVTWVLADWRLDRAAAITEDFGHWHDASHAGRIGNTVTINGRVPDRFAVRQGERIRLRLINAANARIFGLDFAEQPVQVIALDGHPVTPHAPEDGRIVLGPGMRADLVLDIAAAPGANVPVIDRFYPRGQYRLVAIAAAAEPLRARTPDWPIALAPNPLPEPDLGAARRVEVVFDGGMMGRMMMGSGMMEMMRSGRIWAINGVSAMGHAFEPMLTLARGESCVLAMANETAWPHPMHLHGHAFRVLARDGRPTRHREWLDTVLVAPRERVEIAFVADNPGDWMFHCHILEHQQAGMMAVIRVA